MKTTELKEITRILKRGGVIIFPTETVYGIGADSFIKKGIRKIYEIKRRDRKKPLTLHLSDPSHIYKFGEVNSVAKIIIENFLPGPITIILPKKRNIPRYIVAGKKKVGFRVPNCKVSQEIISYYGGPISATSVNISGSPPLNDIDKIEEMFRNSVDYIVREPCKLSKMSSTILDLTYKPFKVIREGEIKIEEIVNFLRRYKVL